jgi:sulfite exporter TauE/SafE
MHNTFITHLQIFGIGLSFGLAGPCFLTCMPILITYLAGKKGPWAGAMRDIFIFLTGRLAAYCLLGSAAGLSAGVLNRFTHPETASFFKPLAGAISILLGILILVSKDKTGEKAQCAVIASDCKAKPKQERSNLKNGLLQPLRPSTGSRRTLSLPKGRGLAMTNLFALGFALGIAPCAPLAALLFEIALMSKSALDGASYALSFGMGTFISGLIVAGAVAGIIKWIPSKILKSKTSSLIFRIACAILLMLLGVSLIFTHEPESHACKGVDEWLSVQGSAPSKERNPGKREATTVRWWSFTKISHI